MKKEFKIDPELYLESHIKEAIIDFKDIAQIEFKNYVLIIEGDSNNEINEIFNELMNYVISLDI